MLNSLYKLFEHKCVLEVCVHIYTVKKVEPTKNIKATSFRRFSFFQLVVLCLYYKKLRIYYKNKLRELKNLLKLVAFKF